MTSRLKEDERNERAIRNLLKLPENRRCINCNSLGPQYVCTSFWTFVCTTCSGIHREFTHRVKSVSMAKFTSQEVSALQGGGNASAKEIYFKEWDPQRHFFPDSSNVQRLREFIKHVYEDRRYTDEKSFNKAPKVKVWEPEDSYREASRSPPFRPSPGGSPPTARSNNVNDRKLEDRLQVEFQSSDHQKDPDISSPPVIRPVKDILANKVSIRAIEPPKVNGLRPSNGSLSTQITVSSNGNPTEQKTENSLIDFDSVPEQPSTTQLPQIQQTAPASAPAVTQPTTTSNNNWANFDSIQEMKTSSNTNLLDILSELSVPPSSLPGASISAPQPSGNTQFSPSVNTTTTDGGQWQNQASSHSFNQAVGGSQNNQPWNSSLSGNAQMLSSSQVTHGVDVKPSAKKELPVDLFSSNYSSYAAPGPRWFPAPQYGMGYNVPMPMPPSYMQPSKPLNPFDVYQSSPVQATTLPSMTPLQGAIPNMVPQSGIHRTSSLGTPSSTQLSHPLSMSQPQVPSYGSPMPSGQFTGHLAPNMQQPSRPQAGGFGSDNNSFGSFNFSQQQSGSSFSSTRGNPFG